MQRHLRGTLRKAVHLSRSRTQKLLVSFLQVSQALLTVVEDAVVPCAMIAIDGAWDVGDGVEDFIAEGFGNEGHCCGSEGLVLVL